MAAAEAELPLHDVLIVGAGPAGLTAATYLARYRRDIVVVDAGKSRARWIPTSHNCPGFPFGVGGDQLLKRYRDQAGQYGVEVIEGRIGKLERGAGEDAHFIATAEDGRRWRARHVLLATGVVDRMPALGSLPEAIEQQAVRLCAICDGYEASDSEIAVLAPIDEAIRHALFLRTYSCTVAAIATDDGAADPALAAQADAAGVAMHPAPSTMALDAGGVRVEWPDGRQHRFDTLYPVLGSDAQSGLALELGARHDDNRELIVDASLRTSVEGLYAIGDVVSALNQISVAVGHAALAATDVHNRLPRNMRPPAPAER